MGKRGGRSQVITAVAKKKRRARGRAVSRRGRNGRKTENPVRRRGAYGARLRTGRKASGWSRPRGGSRQVKAYNSANTQEGKMPRRRTEG